MLLPAFLTIGALLITLQTTLFHILPEWIGKPDLIFVLIVFLGLNMDITKGAVLVLLFGLIMDIFSGIYLGLYPVIFLLLFFILRGISKHLAIDETSHMVPIMALAYLFASSGIFIFSALLAPESELNWSWSNILMQIVILAIICIPCCSMFKKIMQFFDKKTTRPSLFRAQPKNRFRI